MSAAVRPVALSLVYSVKSTSPAVVRSISSAAAYSPSPTACRAAARSGTTLTTKSGVVSEVSVVPVSVDALSRAVNVATGSP